MIKVRNQANKAAGFDCFKYAVVMSPLLLSMPLASVRPSALADDPQAAPRSLQGFRKWGSCKCLE